MKKFHITAFVLSSLVATATVTGAQASSTGIEKAPHARHAMGRGVQKSPARGLLRGLNLSADEKARLKEIHAKYRAESKTTREALKPALLDARAARQKGDTAGARAILEQVKGSREQGRARMVRQAADLRAVLSAENQKLFDANLQKVSSVRAKQGKAVRGKLARRAAGARKPNA